MDSLRHIIGKVKTNTRLRSHLQGKVSHTLSETLSFSFQSIWSLVCGHITVISVTIGVMSGVYLSARIVYTFGKKKNSALVTFWSLMRVCRKFFSDSTLFTSCLLSLVSIIDTYDLFSYAGLISWTVGDWTLILQLKKASFWTCEPGTIKGVSDSLQSNISKGQKTRENILKAKHGD